MATTPEVQTVRGSDDPKASCLQLAQLHERVRGQIEALRREVDAPATRAILRQLDAGQGSSLELGVARVLSSLSQVLIATEASSAAIDSEMRKIVGDEGPTVERGLPPGLRRFVEERSNVPGFEYRLGRDPDRGITVEWSEFSSDGAVRGCGTLFEHPHGWIGED
jgi:DNA-binding FrmR family transcriptional regulator